VAIPHPCIQEDNPHVFVEVQFYVELEPIKVSKLEARKDHTQTRPKILRYTTPLTSQERLCSTAILPVGGSAAAPKLARASAILGLLYLFLRSCFFMLPFYFIP
jgi:hypothetical protein